MKVNSLDEFTAHGWCFSPHRKCNKINVIVVLQSTSNRVVPVLHNHTFNMLTAYRKVVYALPVGHLMENGPAPRAEVLQGTLILLVLRTLDTLGPLHGYGIARRIEQISNDLLHLNQGTLYPALLRMEQEGWITSEWGASEKNRKARFYSITKSGRGRLAKETEDWKRMSSTIERFLVFDPTSPAKERG